MSSRHRGKELVGESEVEYRHLDFDFDRIDHNHTALQNFPFTIPIARIQFWTVRVAAVGITAAAGEMGT